jgi:cell division septum initiation protein DivIVA
MIIKAGDVVKDLIDYINENKDVHQEIKQLANAFEIL